MMTLDKFEEASEVVKEVTNKTKLVHSAYLSEMSGNKVYLKPENMQVFDALIDTADGEIYLELKNAKQKEVVRLCDVLAQIEQAKRKAGKK